MEEDKQNANSSEENEEVDAKLLFEIIVQHCGKIFKDQYGAVHAEVELEMHDDDNKIVNIKTILPVNSDAFRQYISKIYYETTGQMTGKERINSAILLLAAYANEQRTLYNRIALVDGRILYYMTDRKERVISIDTSGWHFIDHDKPLIFRRWAHQHPQVEPAEDGDIELLRPYLAIKDKDWLLIKVALVSDFIPHIPKIVICPYGNQGAGKTILSKIFKRLIDPSAIEVASFPKDKSEMSQFLSHHYFVAFDNVSYIREWQSDVLCRAVTGEGFSKRQLYTDQDDVIFSFRCALILNGINAAPQRPDLLDRSILIEMERIQQGKRKTEEELLQSFEKDRSKILAGIFDILSKAIELRPEINLNEKPRMADFAVWGEAISQAMGYSAGKFLRAYLDNMSCQHEEAISASVVGSVLLQLISEKELWEGTATRLLNELEQKADELGISTTKQGWPRAPHALTRKLNELKTNLQELGIHIESTKDAKARLYTIRKIASEASTSSESAETNKNQQNLNDAINDASSKDEATSQNSVTENAQQLQKNADLKRNDGNDANDANLPTNHSCYYHKDKSATGSVQDSVRKWDIVWLCEDCLKEASSPGGSNV